MECLINSSHATVYPQKKDEEARPAGSLPQRDPAADDENKFSPHSPISHLPEDQRRTQSQKITRQTKSVEERRFLQNKNQPEIRSRRREKKRRAEITIQVERGRTADYQIDGLVLDVLQAHRVVPFHRCRPALSPHPLL